MAKRPTPEVVPSEATDTKIRTPKTVAAVTTAETNGEKVTGKARRHFGRGWLAEAIDGIFRKVEAGTLVHDGPLTVSALRSLVANSEGEQPSTGAVSAVLDRWSKEGYIKVSGKPVAFTGFTRSYVAEKGAGLESFLETSKNRRRRARLAAKTVETVDA